MVSTDTSLFLDIWNFNLKNPKKPTKPNPKKLHIMKTAKLQALEIPTQNHVSARFINDPAWAIQPWVIPEGGWTGGGMREGQGAGASPMWDGSGWCGCLPAAGGGRARLGWAPGPEGTGDTSPACHRAALGAWVGTPQVSIPRCCCRALQGKRSFSFTVSVCLRNTGKELLLYEHF